jgi:hypothetical protein
MVTALMVVAMMEAALPATAIPIDICVVGQASCPTSEAQCLDGGWQTFTDIAGNPRFTNELECTNFVKENFEMGSSAVPAGDQSYCAWYWDEWYGWYYWCY